MPVVVEFPGVVEEASRVGAAAAAEEKGILRKEIHSGDGSGDTYAAGEEVREEEEGARAWRVLGVPPGGDGGFSVRQLSLRGKRRRKQRRKKTGEKDASNELLGDVCLLENVAAGIRSVLYVVVVLLLLLLLLAARCR